MAYQYIAEQDFTIEFDHDNDDLLQRAFGSNAQFSEFENEAELARWFEKDYAFHPSFRRRYYYATMAIGQGSCIFIRIEKPSSTVQGNMIIRERYTAWLNFIGANANKFQEPLSNIQFYAQKVIDNAVHIHENDPNRKIEVFFFTIIDIIHDKCQACCGHLLRLSINQALEVQLRSWSREILRRIEQDRRRDLVAFMNMLDNKIDSIKIEIKQIAVESKDVESKGSDKERATQTFRYWMALATSVVLALMMYNVQLITNHNGEVLSLNRFKTGSRSRSRSIDSRSQFKFQGCATLDNPGEPVDYGTKSQIFDEFRGAGFSSNPWLCL